MSLFRGRLNIRELGSEGWSLQADQSEAWIQGLLERAAPAAEVTGLSAQEWAKKCQYKTDLSFSMAGSDCVLEGNFRAQVPASCSRCAENYPVDRQLEFRLIFHRLERGEGDAQQDTGDPDYILLSNDEIDLIEVLSEQLMILEPVAECPARREDGSCTLCGKNPQFAGQSLDNSANSPFAKLRTFKLKKEV